MRVNKEPYSLKTVARELKNGTWLGNAQARASRRKSPWNLLLVLALPAWLLLYFACLGASRRIATAVTHGKPFAEALIWPGSIAPVLLFPLLLATAPVAMVLINYFIYLCVPPARRAMDAEDRAFPGTEYATQQPLMLRIVLLTFPIAFVLAVVGQLFI